MKYDVVVCIGRFAPIENSHKAALDRALALAARVIVIVGAARKPRTIAHPWSAAERAAMIAGCFTAADQARIDFGAVADSLYNEAQWVRTIQAEVARLAGNATRIGLIADPVVLAMFPQWTAVEPWADDSGDAARGLYLGRPDDAQARARIALAVPPGASAWLDRFRTDEAFALLCAQHTFIANYKAAWSAAPYPPVYVTVDAAVVHSGHLLLIRRGGEPGKGLWALPGGFLDQNERIFDACVRELREETRLAVPGDVLRGALRDSRVFDHPRRSLRGRTITHAFCFVFPSGSLPAVTPDDDADRARWVPLAEFAEMPEFLFDDHYDIGMYFLGRI